MATTPATNSSTSGSDPVAALQAAQQQAEQVQAEIDASTAQFDAIMAGLTGEVKAFDKETSQ
jgi:K+-transporting ATPase c subunit